MKVDYIWVIQTSENLNLLGCYFDKKQAENYIFKNKIKCILTKYPVGESVYEWVISNDFWKPKNDLQKSPKFMMKFNSAYLEHYHYFQEEEL